MFQLEGAEFRPGAAVREVSPAKPKLCGSLTGTKIQSSSESHGVAFRLIGVEQGGVRGHTQRRVKRVGCLFLGHRWEGDRDDHANFPILHCTRCGKLKAFPPERALDPIWRLGRVGRARLLAKQAAHYVGLVIVIGLAVAGVVTLLAYAAGATSEAVVKVFAIASGGFGGTCVLAATLIDPMGASFSLGFPGVVARPSRVPPPAGTEKIMRLDDVLYAGGVGLIGVALLIGLTLP
jgi:hypothetical protein